LASLLLLLLLVAQLQGLLPLLAVVGLSAAC
jgi:hypothetical protein